MSEEETKYGATVRRLRIERNIGLRKFAQMVGISPTYLSKVERDQFPPPAEDKVIAIANALDQDSDEHLALAGRVASELSDIIKRQPREMANFLRVANGLSGEEVQKLTEEARRRKRTE